MGAGVSTGAAADGLAAHQPDPEGYDSELEAEANEDYTRLEKPQQGSVFADTAGGRLSRAPLGGKTPFACAGQLHPPAGYETLSTATEPPDNTLQLDFVHGYRGHDARHNLFFSGAGKLVYHAAGVGVVMDPVSREQSFFQGHDDDVVCLAMHPDSDIVATAQVGSHPTILVWSSSSCKLLACIKGFHKKAVIGLSFSPDGRILGSVGKDDMHSVALYEWRSDPVEATGVFQGKLLATAEGDYNRIFCCAFSPDGRFVTGGQSHLQFYVLDPTPEGFELTGTMAEYSHRARRGFAVSTVLCIAFNPERCTYVGTKGGNVYKFEEDGVRAVKKYDSVHQGPVSEIVYSASGNFIITGGKDGRVKFHNTFMLVQFEINLCKVVESLVDDDCNPMSFSGSRAPYVRALCHNAQTNKVIVGTSSSEIFEFDVSTPDAFKTPLGRQIIIQGHASSVDHKAKPPVMAGEVWGLDTHPFKPVYATAGDDRSVRLWSCEDHNLVTIRKLKGRARSVAWHPKGNVLAVGCLKGQIFILDTDIGRVVTSNDCKSEIKQLRFSPSGKFLAATVGMAVHVFDTLKGQNGSYVQVEDCTGLSGHAVGFDWSLCGRFLRANCSNGGLYGFTMPDGEPCSLAVGSPASEVQWATTTCLASWECQGVWPQGAQRFEDINACCRNKRGDWREDECVLATVDDFGAVRLFKYPSDVGRAGFNEYMGHSAHATNCGFTYNDKYLITVGGADRCVFQWRHLEGEEDANDDSDEEDNLRHDAGKGHKHIVMVQTGMASGESEFEPLNAMEGLPNPYKNHSLPELKAKRGYKAPIVGRPVMGQMHVPSDFEVTKETYEACKQTLQLKWVQGYRGWDTRQNVFYTQGDQIAYHAAAVGICYDPKTKTQRFITDDPESEGVAEGNTDDILCMARHPNKSIFATGEIGLKPKIIIWDASTMVQLNQVGGFHRRAVIAMTFSPGEGTYLASVGQDNDHSVAIYDWKKEELLATFKGDQNPVLSISWSPYDNVLVTTGVKHIKFVTDTFTPSKPITKGWRVRPKKGLIGKKGKIQNFYTCAFLGQGRTVTGTRSGELYVFEKVTLVDTVKAHKSKVCAVHTVDSLLISGGDDGVVKMWNTADMTLAHQVAMPSMSISESACIRSVFADSKHAILVGTKTGEIYEITDKPKLLVQSHQEGELWGLAIHPEGKTFTSASDDGTLRTWCTESREQLACTRLVQKPLPLENSSLNTGCIRSVAYSPDGHMIAAGTVNGKSAGTFGLNAHLAMSTPDYEKLQASRNPGLRRSTTKMPQIMSAAVYLLRSGTLDHLSVLDERNQWVTDIKWSPTGKYLAVATHDSFIDIYECDRGYKLVSSCKGHSSFVTHIGWSADESTLFSNSGDYEILFWEIPSGKRIQQSSSCKDTKWNAYTGTLGWPVLGIWHKGADGTDVNTCDRMPHTHECVATGDDRGLVSLYRFPALGGKARVYGGHSSHVTTVRFAPDGSKLYSAGGGDACIMEWALL